MTFDALSPPVAYTDVEISRAYRVTAVRVSTTVPIFVGGADNNDALTVAGLDDMINGQGD
jgi:hypothetical protein